MDGLEAYGLQLTTVTLNHGNEQRHEVRLSETGVFVAWFQITKRESNKELVTSTNSQLIHHTFLTSEQVEAVRDWLKDMMDASY